MTADAVEARASEVTGTSNQREAFAELDAEALVANTERARAVAPASAIFATIKAQGYGHGLLWTAQTLAPHCEGFAVATVGEGLALRDAGFREHRVCVLNGATDADELAACAAHGLEPLVHQEWHVAALETRRLEAPVRVWLKVDSGMGRLGVRPWSAAPTHRRLSECPAVRGPVGLMTHLARADDCRSSYTRDQLITFDEATRGIQGPRSVANSAGVLGWRATHAEWNRPGVMLYGCSPFTDDPGRTREAFDLQPVMRLSTRLIAVNELEAGTAVGYGGAFVCPEAMPVGVAAIGYGDGYPRHAPTGTPVAIRGRRVPLIGRVSMDKITLDLRAVPEASVGDRVELWGDEVAVEAVAAAAWTIGYELLAGIHGRVPMYTSAS
jgi:alanine racemase